MEQLYIPSKRARLLRGKSDAVRMVEHMCKCTVSISHDDTIEIKGQDAFSEFSAKNILFAFGRGFDINTACRLNNPDQYFSSIDIEQLISNENRKKQLKSRVIGSEGRTRKYIEEVSGAHMSVYGDTVSFIGTIEEINEAETAVNTLLEGGTHRLAYTRMEAAHRKNKRQAHMAKF